jgi:hypothetical protein
MKWAVRAAWFTLSIGAGGALTWVALRLFNGTSA